MLPSKNNYLGYQLKINKCGHQVNFNWCGYLVKFKQFHCVIKFIFCCFPVKINYLSSKVKINKCGHQVNFKQFGYLVKFQRFGDPLRRCLTYAKPYQNILERFWNNWNMWRFLANGPIIFTYDDESEASRSTGQYSRCTVSSPLEIHGVSSELVYVSRKVYLILIYI